MAFMCIRNIALLSISIISSNRMHRHIKRRFAKSVGFQNLRHASRTIKGIETIHAIYKQNQSSQPNFGFRRITNYRNYSKLHKFYIPNEACFVYLKTLQRNPNTSRIDNLSFSYSRCKCGSSIFSV